MRFTVGVLVDTFARPKEVEKLLTAHQWPKGQEFIAQTVPSHEQTLMTPFPFTGMTSVMIALARVYPASGRAAKALGIEPHKEGVVVEVTSMKQSRSDFYFVLQPPAPQLREFVKGL